MLPHKRLHRIVLLSQNLNKVSVEELPNRLLLLSQVFKVKKVLITRELVDLATVFLSSVESEKRLLFLAQDRGQVHMLVLRNLNFELVLDYHS